MRVPLWLQKIRNGGMFLIAIIIILLCLRFYLGISAYLWVGIILPALGVWAIMKVWPKFKPAANVLGALGWYAFFVVQIISVATTLLRYDIKHMYEYWVYQDQSFLGALYFFLPALGLTIGATMAAITATEKWKFSRKTGICLAIISLVTTLAYGMVDPASKLFHTKKQEIGQGISLSESELAKKIGKYARVINEEKGAWVYEEDPTTHLFMGKTWLAYLDRLPRPVKEEERMDGVYKLINVILHDANGEYTAAAFQTPRWIRHENVRQEPRDAELFYLEKVNDKIWRVHFYTDEEVKVLDQWPLGKKITFAIEPVGDTAYYTTNGLKFSLLPIGDPPKSPLGSYLIIKHKKGGTITLKIS